MSEQGKVVVEARKHLGYVEGANKDTFLELGMVLTTRPGVPLSFRIV
jgi:hypothetical protein